MNENESTTCLNLEDAVKAVLRGTFIAVNTYIKGKEFQINNLTFHFKKLR